MASNLGLNPQAFALCVAFGAGTSLVTPVGYQTNLIVFGPGGYKFRDYMKIGLPLTFIYMVVTVVILIWQFDLST